MDERTDIPGTQTDAAQMPVTTPEGPPPPKIGVVESFFGVLTSPGSTFQKIVDAKSWNFIVILVLLIIVGVGSQFVVQTRFDMSEIVRDQITQSPRSADMTPEDIDRAVEMQTKFAPIGYIITPIMIPLVCIIIAFILWLAFLATGGSAKFVGCWRVFTWAQIPPVLKSIVFFIMAFIRNPENINIQNPIATNPAYFLDSDKVAKPLYAVLSRMDIFTFWMLFLLAVGMSAESKKSKGLSAAVVVGLWLITVVIHGVWKIFF